MSEVKTDGLTRREFLQTATVFLLDSPVKGIKNVIDATLGSLATAGNIDKEIGEKQAVDEINQIIGIQARLKDSAKKLEIDKVYKDVVGNLSLWTNSYLFWDRREGNISSLERLIKSGNTAGAIVEYERIKKSQQESGSFRIQDYLLIGSEIGRKKEKGELKFEAWGVSKADYQRSVKAVIKAMRKLGLSFDNFPHSLRVAINQSRSADTAASYEDLSRSSQPSTDFIALDPQNRGRSSEISARSSDELEGLAFHELFHFLDLETNRDLVKFMAPEQVVELTRLKMGAIVESERQYPDKLEALLVPDNGEWWKMYPNHIYSSLGAYPGDFQPEYLIRPDKMALPGIEGTTVDEVGNLVDFFKANFDWAENIAQVNPFWKIVFGELEKLWQKNIASGTDVFGQLSIHGLSGRELMKESLIRIGNLVLGKMLWENDERLKIFESEDDKWNAASEMLQIMSRCNNEGLAQELRAKTDEYLADPETMGANETLENLKANLTFQYVKKVLEIMRN